EVILYTPSSGAIFNHIQQAVIGYKVNVVGGFVGWRNENPQITIIDTNQLVFLEPSDAELVQMDMDAFKNEFDTKSFNMETAVTFETVGEFGSSISWTIDPAEAIVDGK